MKYAKLYEDSPQSEVSTIKALVVGAIAVGGTVAGIAYASHPSHETPAPSSVTSTERDQNTRDSQTDIQEQHPGQSPTSIELPTEEH